jgi:hypothetical protein
MKMLLDIGDPQGCILEKQDTPSFWRLVDWMVISSPICLLDDTQFREMYEICPALSFALGIILLHQRIMSIMKFKKCECQKEQLYAAPRDMKRSTRSKFRFEVWRMTVLRQKRSDMRYRCTVTFSSG